MVSHKFHFMIIKFIIFLCFPCDFLQVFLFSGKTFSKWPGKSLFPEKMKIILKNSNVISMRFYFYSANLPEKWLGKIKIQEVTFPRKKKKREKPQTYENNSHCHIFFIKGVTWLVDRYFTNTDVPSYTVVHHHHFEPHVIVLIMWLPSKKLIGWAQTCDSKWWWCTTLEVDLD